MLLRRVHQLPEGDGWRFEVKWDGYRMQALKTGNRVRLLSRNGADYTHRFSAVAEAVSRIKARALHLDGELVAMDQSGRPSFQALQAWRRLPKGWQIGFYAFDLLQINDARLMTKPLSIRRAVMHEALVGSALKISEHLDGTAGQILKVVKQHRLEGVVAKREDSLYEPGKRSGAWVKVPLKQTGTF